MASLKLIFGPMFSGKTTHLIEQLVVYADLNFPTLYVNHDVDCRSSEDGIATSHSSQFNVISPKIDKTKTTLLSQVDVEKYKVIGVDEGQFYQDLVEVVDGWLQVGKIVIIAGLDGDFRMKSFGRMHELISLADAGGICKLAAKCIRCLEEKNILIDAGFTARYTQDSDLILVGGQESYRAVCRQCHIII